MYQLWLNADISNIPNFLWVTIHVQNGQDSKISVQYMYIHMYILHIVGLHVHVPIFHFVMWPLIMFFSFLHHILSSIVKLCLITLNQNSNTLHVYLFFVFELFYWTKQTAKLCNHIIYIFCINNDTVMHVHEAHNTCTPVH